MEGVRELCHAVLEHVLSELKPEHATELLQAFRHN